MKFRPRNDKISLSFKAFFIIYILRGFKLFQVILTINKLYKIIPTYSISKLYRNTEEPANPDMIYGELSIHAFIYLLALVPKKINCKIYDLGCGDGKLLLATVLFFKNINAIGVEKIAALKNSALQIGLTLSSKIDQNKSSLAYIEEDFLNQNFSDADIVYINGAALQMSTWNQLCARFKNLNKGSYIISVERKYEDPEFILIYSGLHSASWGNARVYVYYAQNKENN